MKSILAKKDIHNIKIRILLFVTGNLVQSKEQTNEYASGSTQFVNRDTCKLFLIITTIQILYIFSTPF